MKRIAILLLIVGSSAAFSRAQSVDSAKTVGEYCATVERKLVTLESQQAEGKSLIMAMPDGDERESMLGYLTLQHQEMRRLHADACNAHDLASARGAVQKHVAKLKAINKEMTDYCLSHSVCANQ